MKKYNRKTNPQLYEKWHSMKKRCFNKKAQNYKYYGGRGITVCDEWLEFGGFYEWAITHGFEPNLTIERIDTNKNYEPSNCKWIPMHQQFYNRRSNVWITIDGETLSLLQWSQKTKLHITTIRGRLMRGDKGKDLIRPPHPGKKTSDVGN